jgi:hypothetical protein
MKVRPHSNTIRAASLAKTSVPAPSSSALEGSEPGAAPRTLRILLLEDNAPHAELVEHFLRESGLKFQLTRVESSKVYVQATTLACELWNPRRSFSRYSGG